MSAVEAKAKAAHLAGKGITGELGIDWKTLMAFQAQLHGHCSHTDEAGLSGYQESRLMKEKQDLSMNKRCGLVQEIVSADQFLIATGQRPALLPD